MIGFFFGFLVLYLIRFQITWFATCHILTTNCIHRKNKNRCDMSTSVTFTHISIPIELLEEILRCGWLSPQFMRERIAFMTSVALVSKTWLQILLRIIYRDVYIPSTPYLDHDRQFIVRQSPLFHKFLPDVSPSQLCRTITQQIPVSNKTTRHGRLSHFRGKLVQNMLSTFHGLSLMPNLRTLAAEYYNPAFRENHTFPFCASIIQLHLEYTFGSDCPSWLVDALLASRQSTSNHFPWALPHLEHISASVNEDPTSFVKVLDCCPHLRLAEEMFTVRVHILSSLRVPENCIIFHGIMPSFDARVVNYHDFGPKTVRGCAPVLVLMKDDDRDCEPSMDLSNMFRNVQVFVHKNE